MMVSAIHAREGARSPLARPPRFTDPHITLAVLPFADLSSEQALGIFRRSFSEDLITELSRFQQLRVVRFSEEPSAGGVRQWLDAMSDGYFVRGTFRSEKETVHINVQLYDGDHRLVWGKRFEGPLTQVYDLQDSLLKSVVAVLQGQINRDLLSKLRQRPRVAFSAYEHWLYGMEELKKASLEADLKAREHFEKALRIQPDYALAYTGMSLSYFNEWTCQLWDRWNISKTGAFKWAKKAIELDEENYVATMVLGRIFLYEGSYHTAEYYFRKSLSLNSNDPNTLFLIALYLVYLGLNQEALEWYERALELYPFYAINHFRIVGFIHFEMGEYEKAASYIQPHQIGQDRIADTDAIRAATYYYLGRYDQMQVYWDAFLATYRRLISKGKDFDQQEAIDWLLKLNPHRYQSNMEEFLRFISRGSFDKYPVRETPPKAAAVQGGFFVKEGATWKFTFAGHTVQAPEVKGFYDLQKMLASPRQAFHCAELMGSTLNDGKGEKLIDEKARQQYQRKIIALQSDIEEAEQYSDFARLEELQAEYDRLVDHLAQSLNLKGKIRQSGGTVEKARSAVTWRIRHAIARIEQQHPALGAHLANAVKTGTLCAYKPERDIEWVTA